MRKFLVLFMWLSCLSVATRGQTLDDADLSELLQTKQALAFDYWFDDDTGHLQTVNSLSGTYAFDVSSLTNGLHMLHCQIKGANGEIYVTDSRLFLTMNDTENLSGSTLVGAKLRYWFDEDAGSLRDVSSVSGTYSVDVSALSDGLHILHYMLVGADGSAYGTRAETFIKMEEILTDPTALETVSAQSVTYWYDDNTDNKQTANSLSGIYTLDVSTLDDGLHLLHYYVVGEDGQPYGLTSRMFLKDEGQFAVHEPSRITKYTYWVNNSAIETVTLDQPVNPYSLISLLPLQTMPIRSSNFHFQVNDGVPTIYAKNTFNIRFFDSEDRFVDNFIDNERTFIDYGVSQPVIGAELIESGIGATTEKPAENTIKWYYLSAEPGDSLEFQLDRAATIQLFAPSGKEVYRASGAASVRWDGCHARETGIYYLAIHDVAATMGNEINIGYNHIDKYAVLRQDVSVVGNGGCSTITFEGNGFRDLYAVELYDGLGNTIQHAYIGHESDAKTSVVFDFTDATIGQYSALFHFTDEDKVFTNLVIVEETKGIKLITTSNHSSQYISGGTARYTFDVRNNGNMTAYSVPIYAYISTKTKNGISRIGIKGLKLTNLYDYIENKDSIDVNTLMDLKCICDSIGEEHYFNKFATTDEQSGDSIVVRSGFFTIDIQPNSSKTITIDVQSTEIVNVWLTIPEEWHSIILAEDLNANVRTVSSATDWLCCYHEQLECLATIIVDVADVVGLLPIPQAKIATVISCITGFVNQTVNLTSNVLCNEENINKSFYDKIKMISDGISISGTLLTCASTFVKAEQMKEMLSCLSLSGDILTHPFAAVDCIKAWTKKKPNCPQTSLNGVGIRGGVSIPVFSKDPNEIYGYTAESGSKAVMDGQTDVYYTIEFENDPEFATASAHDIYLTDILDATKFDLSTYKPTRVKIGNKSADLSGEKNFVTTVDMRPEIYAIAQVEGSFDEQTGVANWHISSLDPMTMEPTENLLDGVLPVNTDGLGIGEVSFDISLKPGLTHGTEISNQASIIFDNNDPIVTPVWTNIMDCVKPESHVTNVTQTDGGMAEVSVSATDELSGPWRYDVYVQYGQGSAWFKAAENVDIGKTAKVPIYPGIDHGFCTIVTDAAGNVEQKTTAREFSLSVPYILGDVNGDGKVTVTDVLMIMDKAQGNPPKHFIEEAADLNDDGAVTLTDAMMALAKILDND